MSSEDVGRIFQSDSKTKKRTANGSFAKVKSGKRGMVTAYSLMTKDQQREYTRCDEGESYNIYESIISIENLKNLPLEIRIRCWTSWLDRFFLEDIMSSWMVGTVDELNSILIELDLPMVQNDEELLDEIVTQGDVVVNGEADNDTGLTLSDLIASDAKITDIQCKGDMESTELIQELSRIVNKIKDTPRNYSVEISIKEYI